MEVSFSKNSESSPIFSIRPACNAPDAIISPTGCSHTLRNSTVPRKVRSSNLNDRKYCKSEIFGWNVISRYLFSSKYSPFIRSEEKYLLKTTGGKLIYFPSLSTQYKLILFMYRTISSVVSNTTLYISTLWRFKP